MTSFKDSPTAGIYNQHVGYCIRHLPTLCIRDKFVGSIIRHWPIPHCTISFLLPQRSLLLVRPIYSYKIGLSELSNSVVLQHPISHIFKFLFLTYIYWLLCYCIKPVRQLLPVLCVVKLQFSADPKRGVIHHCASPKEWSTDCHLEITPMHYRCRCSSLRC